jgi:hypothetical protein
VPNSHPIVANAKPEFQREPQFITGHPPVRCSAQAVVMLHFGSFSPLQLMKRFTLALEIHMLTKWEEGFNSPFLVANRRKRTNVQRTICALDAKYATINF